MSKIIIDLPLGGFIALFKFTQEIHSKNKEPIPELNSDNIPKIETALNQPFQTFDGIQLYKGLVKKAAILFYLIIDNHVINNGNKRMACITLSFFCFINKYNLEIDPDILESLAKEVASPHNHELMLKRIEQAIRKHLVKVSHSKAIKSI